MVQASDTFVVVSGIPHATIWVELYRDLLCITVQGSPFHYNVVLIFLNAYMHKYIHTLGYLLVNFHHSERDFMYCKTKAFSL